MHVAPISREISDGIGGLCRHEGVTSFMALVAAYQSLLFRYTRQAKITVGTDLANRNSIETEQLIGFFINMMPICTDFSGDPTFRELLGRVRDVSLGAFAHQELPFDKLVEELAPERTLSYTPLVQVLFVLQNAPREPLQLPGTRITTVPMNYDHCKFDLALFMVERPEGLCGWWQFQRELFDESTVARMAKHFEALLASIVANPDSRISALEYLSAAEKDQKTNAAKQRKDAQFKRFMDVKVKSVAMAAGADHVGND
jgi:non-ribosomal peptide synthetase component F